MRAINSKTEIFWRQILLKNIAGALAPEMADPQPDEEGVVDIPIPTKPLSTAGEPGMSWRDWLAANPEPDEPAPAPAAPKKYMSK